MDFFLGQVAALLTFFAFPAVQYGLLKVFARRQGRPQLWFLPRFGFRLVVHNISGRRILSDIRYKTILRRRISAGNGSSVATFEDTVLVEREDTFCFPGTDQVLLSFRLVSPDPGRYALVHTNKIGEELSRYDLTEADSLIADYTATIENFFNFDVRLAKRSELFSASWASLANPGVEEGQFPLDRIRDVG